MPGSKLCAVGIALCACACGDNQEFDASRVWGGNLAIDGNVLFTTTYDVGPDKVHAVWAIPLHPGEALQINEARQIFKGHPGWIFGNGMAVVGGNVYWSSDGESAASVFRVAIDGASQVEHVTDFSSHHAPYGGLRVDDSSVYAMSNEVISAPLAGGSATRVYGAADWFTIRNNDILLGVGDNTLRVSKTDGTLSTQPTNCGPAFDENYFYCVRSANQGSRLLRMGIDDGQTVALASFSQEIITNPCVANGWVYFNRAADAGGMVTISRVSIGGGPVESLGQLPFHAIFASSGAAVYYSSHGAVGRVDDLKMP